MAGTFQVTSPGAAAPSSRAKTTATVRTSFKPGQVLACICGTQIAVSLCLLGLYEGKATNDFGPFDQTRYKAYYYNTWLPNSSGSTTASSMPAPVEIYEDPLDWRSPMGASYYWAAFNSVFAVFGIAGILNAQRILVLCYFCFNVAQMVIAFHFFVDLLTDASLTFNGEPERLSAYEKATTAFIFLSWLLSCGGTVYSMRSLDDIKAKQRDEYNRFTVLSDTLQFEPDI